VANQFFSLLFFSSSRRPCFSARSQFYAAVPGCFSCRRPWLLFLPLSSPSVVERPGSFPASTTFCLACFGFSQPVSHTDWKECARTMFRQGFFYLRSACPGLDSSRFLLPRFAFSRSDSPGCAQAPVDLVVSKSQMVVVLVFVSSLPQIHSPFFFDPVQDLFFSSASAGKVCFSTSSFSRSVF
jgi:hypothetical protein